MTAIAKITLNIRESNSFIECDISSAMDKMGIRNIPLIYIYSYEGTKEEKIEAIKAILSSINLDNSVVITTAYVSENGNPVEEYDPDNVTYKKIIDEGSEMLESLGFLDINGYIHYTYQRAFIYGNNLGIKIKEFLYN